jgi:hypothetical protein
LINLRFHSNTVLLQAVLTIDLQRIPTFFPLFFKPFQTVVFPQPPHQTNFEYPEEFLLDQPFSLLQQEQVKAELYFP